MRSPETARRVTIAATAFQWAPNHAESVPDEERVVAGSRQHEGVGVPVEDRVDERADR